jgi:hypothetical protein
VILEPQTTDRKRIGKDTRGEVMYPFVLLIALVMVLGFIISGVSQYAQSGTITQGDYPGVTNPFGLYNYTLIDAIPSDPDYVTFTTDDGTIEGYEVTTERVVDHVPYPTYDDPYIFVDPNDEAELKYVHIIRDNVDYTPGSSDMWEMYQDFVAIRRYSEDSFFWDNPWHDAAIPFTTIEQQFDNSTNVSISGFQLSGSQDSLFVNATSGLGESNFISDLWANEFRLFYGWSLFRLDEVDFWGAIAMVLYAEVPGVHPMVNWIFHAFVIGTIVFVVFRMAVMMTPFLGG